MSNILVLSYNEGNKSFDADQCEEVFKKINKTLPDLIVLCSQESRYEGKSFGSILHKEYLLKNYDYIKHDRHSKIFLEEIVISLPNIITKYGDVRTKIFIKKNIKIINSEKTIDFTLGKGSIMSKIEFNNNKFIFVNSHYAFKGSGNTGLEKRTEQFFKTIHEFELYKYVNTHQIFFCGDLNFRLDETYFNKYIENKNRYINKYTPLNQKQKIENNTFNDNEDFIKNLFHLKEKNKITKSTKSIIEKLKKSILNTSKNPLNYSKFKKLHYFINKLQELNNFKKPYEYNELYQIISSPEILEIIRSPEFSEMLKLTNELNENMINLYNNFKKSIEETGIYITCRYREGKEKSPINHAKISQSKTLNKKNSVKYNDRGLIKLKRLSEKSIDNVTKFKENVNICNSIISCEKKGTPRVPSMCDKILYSFTENLNKKIDFFTFFTPNRSDHKMIGILCNINNKSRKNNNKNIEKLVLSEFKY